MQGDFGRANRFNRLVADTLAQVMPHTIELALASLLIAIVVGVGPSVIAAVYRNI